jgi:hypothetical protein
MSFCERNSREGVTMRSEKCAEGVLVDTLNMGWVDGAWGFMAGDRVIMRSDYNVLCLETSGYVTAGNSQVARGYRNSVGSYHCHFQSRIDDTKYMETCILLCR